MKRVFVVMLCILIAVAPMNGALAGIHLPAGLQAIESEAFEGDTSIGGRIVLPEKVQSIGDEAFKDTCAYALIIPPAVTAIGSNVLGGTGAVYAAVQNDSVQLAEDSLNGVGYVLAAEGSRAWVWAQANGVNAADPASLIYEGGFVYLPAEDGAELIFAEDDSVSGEVVVPEEVGGLTVTAIGSYAFSRLYGITAIQVPDTAELPEQRISWPEAEITVYTTDVPAPETPEDAKEIELNNGYMMVNVGDQFGFDWTWLPEGEISFEYLTADESIATVDEEGIVTAVGLGRIHVAAVVTAENGRVYVANCQVEVVRPAVEILTEVTEVTVPVGRHFDHFEWDCEVAGMYENVAFEYKSANTDVVDSDGFAVGAGDAVVTIVATLGDASDSVDILVHVYEPEIHLNDSDLYTFDIFNDQLSITDELPEGAQVKWTSTDEEVFTIDENGVLTPTGFGTATAVCTVTYADGTTKTADSYVTVLAWEFYFEDPVDRVEMQAGESYRTHSAVIRWVTPDHQSLPNITITSSDESVVSFDEERTTIAHKPGTAFINVTAEYLGVEISYSYTIVVYGESEEIIIPMAEPIRSMNVGEEYWPWTEVDIPGDEQYWHWTSSNEDVATVDEEGRVIAHQLGETEITVIIDCGEHGVFTGTNLIKVEEPRIELHLYEEYVRIPVGTDYWVEYDIMSTSVGGYDYSHTVADESILDVPYRGYVTGLKPGVTEVTATVELTNGSGASDTRTFTVEVYEPDFSLNESNIYTYVGWEHDLEIETELENVASVRWYSEDENIAVVDQNGHVSVDDDINGVGEVVKIVCEATLEDGTVLTADCVVEVINWRFGWQGHAEDTVWLEVGDSFFNRITATSIHQMHTEYFSYTQTSSDESIVSIDTENSRYIIAHKPGTAFVTARQELLGHVTEVTYPVIVMGGEAETIPMGEPVRTMNVGDEYWPWVEAELPWDCEHFWQWTTSNGDVASVDEEGRVVAKQLGEAIITANITCGENGECGVFTASMLVKVEEPFLELQLHEDYICIPVGREVPVGFDVLTNSTSEWSYSHESDNTAVAERQHPGYITGIAVGTATLTCTVELNGMTDVKTMTVEVYEPELQLSESNIFAYAGWEYDLKIVTELEDVESVEWYSEDERIVFVDENGHVSVHEEGLVTVGCRVTLNDGTVLTGDCLIEATYWEFGWTEDAHNTVYLEVGEEFYNRVSQTRMHIQHLNTYSFTQTSSDESIVSIDSDNNHYMTAHKPGTVFITARQQLLDHVEEITYAVIVVGGEVENIPMGESVITMNEGDEYWPWVEYELPWDCEHFWQWTSSDEGVATVDEEGRVVAKQLGETVITATITCGENGECGVFTASCLVKVEEPFIEIHVHEDYYLIPAGGAEEAQFSIDFNSTEGYHYEMTAEDGSIVDASNGRILLGLKEGVTEVTVTAELANGGASASRTFTVEVYEPEFRLNEAATFTYTGWEHDLFIESELENVASVEWYSEDEGVATVDENGHVWAHNEGVTNIVCKVTLEDGTEMTAYNRMDVIEWHFEWYYEGETYYMHAGEVYYAGPSNYARIHSTQMEYFSEERISSDEGIVSFNEYGEAVAHRAGTAIITARMKLFDIVEEIQYTICVSDDNVITVPMGVSELTLNPGDEFWTGLEAELPEECEHFWEWSTSDESVVTFEEDRVFATGLGDAMITVTVTCGENGEHGVYQANCYVHVVEPYVEIYLETNEITIPVGRIVKINADYDVHGLWDNLFTGFETDDEEIVNADMFAVAPGTATVYYTAEVNGYKARAEITVHVYEPEFELNMVDRYTFTGFEEQLEVVTELPEGAIVEWFSENEDVFTIDNDGHLWAHNEGDALAVCMITLPDGTVMNADCAVHVSEWIFYWDEYYEPQFMLTGEAYRTHPGLWHMISPQHSSDDVVITLTSSDESIVSIDENRNSVAHRAGEVTIYCHGEYLGRTADYEYTLIVNDPYLEAHLGNDWIDMNVTDTFCLDRWWDSEVDISRVEFTSDDESIVKVGNNGWLYPVSEGETQIHFTVYAGNFSSTASATVIVRGATAQMTPAEKTIEVGETYYVIPETGLYEKLDYGTCGYWTENEEIAYVDSDGLVVGLSAGSTKIHFEMDADGRRVKGEALVHVVDDSAKITLNETCITLNLRESFQLVPSFSGEATDITWTTDTNLSTVDENGVVTLTNVRDNNWFHVVCTAVVDGETVSASCLVIGQSGELYIEDASRIIGMNVGDTHGTWYRLSGAADQEYSIIWESADEDIVTVEPVTGSVYTDGAAELTAVGAGHTQVTLTVVGADGTVYDSWICEVYVETEFPALEWIRIERDTYHLNTEGQDGDRRHINIELNSDLAYHYTNYWFTSSDESIVAIDGEDIVGISEGKATVTVHVEGSDLTAETTVYVFTPEITIDNENPKLGEQFTIALTGVPQDYELAELYYDYDGHMFTCVEETATSVTLRVHRTGESGMWVNASMGDDGWGTGRDFGFSIEGEGLWFAESDIFFCPGEEGDIWTEFGYENGVWSSSDENVATVDEYGRVYATGVGECEIYLTCIPHDIGEERTLTAYIHVRESEWSLERIEVPSVMHVGQACGAGLHIPMTGWWGPEIEWIISDESVLRYDPEWDHFEALSEGEVTITVNATKDGRTETLSKNIKVVEPTLRVADNMYPQLRPGQGLQLELIAKEGLEIQSVEWYSADETRVTVDQGGYVMAQSGDIWTMIVADATFTDGSTSSATAWVRVIPDWDVWVNCHPEDEHRDIADGQTDSFWIHLDTNAAEEEIKITWTVDNNNIVSYRPIEEENNRRVEITGLTEGGTDIWCNVQIGENGSIFNETFQYHVNVYQRYMNVWFDSDSYGISVFSNRRIHGQWDTNVAVEGESYASADESIVKIDAQGNLIPVSEGTTEIYFTAYGDGLEATATAQVTVHGVNGTLNPSEVTIGVGEAVTLIPEADLPEGYNYNNFFFESRNSDIALVNGEGVVTGVKAGTTVITFRMDADGIPVQATATVHVVDSEAKIKLNAEEISLAAWETFQLVPTFSGEASRISWSSEGTVRVDENGLAVMFDSAPNLGEINYVTCTAVVDGEVVSASCMVRYIVPEVLITGFDPLCTVEVGRGTNVNFNALAGSMAEGYSLICTSADEDIAIVTEVGPTYVWVEGVSEGITEITLAIVDAEGNIVHSRTSVICVGDARPEIEKLELWYDFYQLSPEGGYNDYKEPAMSVYPDTGWYFAGIHLRSDDESVVFVDENNNLHGVNPGVATITMYNEMNDVTDTAKVYVFQPDLVLDNENPQVGDMITVTLTGVPEEYTDRELYFTHDEHCYEFVDSSEDFVTLRVRRAGEGWFNVWANFSGGGGNPYSEDFNLSIPGDEFYMNTAGLRMNVGDTERIWPEFGHENQVWSSSNEQVAIVDQDGNITAVGLGECDIYFTCLVHNDGQEHTIRTAVSVEESEWRLVHIENNQPSVIPGCEYDLQCHIIHNGYRPEQTWTVSDENIAHIDVENNRLVVTGEGEFTLTVVVSKDGRSETTSMKIISAEPAAWIQNHYIELRPNASTELTLKIRDDKQLQSVEWRSADTAKVTVDQNGIVTVVGGEEWTMVYADITFTDGTTANASSRVRVIPDWEVWTNSWSQDEWRDIEIGTTDIMWVGLDTNAAEEEISITWTADDPSIVSLTPVADDNGRSVEVTGLAEGGTDIWCNVQIGENGCFFNETRHYHAEVYRRYFEINPSQTEYTVNVGEETHIQWNVSWNRLIVSACNTFASDPSVVEITGGGDRVRGIKPGVSEVTSIYYDNEGNELGQATVTVTVNGLEVSLDAEEITLQAGETAQLTPTVPENGDYEVYGWGWSSENDAAAMVTGDGTVIGIAPGRTRIFYFYETSIGQFSDSCWVNVEGAAEGLVLNANSLTLYDRMTYQLEATVNGKTPDSIEWEAKDSVSVDENGVITAYGSDNENRMGLVTAKATLDGETYTAVCFVEIPIISFGIRQHMYGDGQWRGMNEGDVSDNYELIWKTDAALELTASYRSDDENIASVDENGTIYAHAQGVTCLYMTLSAQTGESYTWPMEVYVNVDAPAVESITPRVNTIVMGAPGVHDYTENDVYSNLEFYPATNGGVELRFYSDDDSVVTVSEYDGWMWAQNPGRTTVRIEAVDHPELNTSIEVLVVGEVGWGPEDGRTVFAPGERVKPVLSNVPWTDDEVENAWIDNPHGAIRLTKDGVLELKSAETLDYVCHYCVQFKSGAEIRLNYFYNIDIDSPYFYLRSNDDALAAVQYQGGYISLEAFSNVWDQIAEVTYESMNPGIASMDEGNTGVHCNALGETSIVATATLSDGSTLTATMPVKVVEAYAPTVRLNNSHNMVVNVGENRGVGILWDYGEITVCPNHYYTSSDESVLKVHTTSDYFYLEAVAPGQATLTVTANYGGEVSTDSITVYVVE